MNNLTLSFYGGAKEVTGANYLLDDGKTKILIDCGLFQGGSFAEEKNFEEFPYDPSEVRAVIVTHAHIDHIGRLPRLFQRGFKGKIICTPPTKDLMMVALEDSIDIITEEAKRKNKPPLYTKKEVGMVESRVHTIGFDEALSLGLSQVRLFDAGHVLGSSIAHIRSQEKTILFSGDLGNSPSVFFHEPAGFKEADYVVMESVYGDRVHKKDGSRQDLLEDVVEDAASQRGVLLIPAFAMERVQEILYDLDQLVSHGKVPLVPVFVDSPLAIEMTHVYKRHLSYYNDEFQEYAKKDKTIFDFPGLAFASSVAESKNINDVEPPKIIIAGSGMSQGGRILHHEMRYLPQPKSTILFVGYQVPHSRGRMIQDGAESVEIFGQTIPVRCKRKTISGFSAHADKEDLVNWVSPMRHGLKKAFIVQGEERSSQELAFQLKDFLGVEAVVPSRGEQFILD